MGGEKRMICSLHLRYLKNTQNSIPDYCISPFKTFFSHQAMEAFKSKYKYKVEKIAQILLTRMENVLIYGDVNNRS